MASIGFDGIQVGIHEGDTEIVKEVIDITTEAGAIEAQISGLGAQMNTTYANNVPFYVSAVGTGTPELTLQVADLGSEVVNKILGVTYENGIEKLGANTEAPYISIVLKSKARSGADLYIALLKGKMAYPDQNLATSTDSGAELNTDEITGTFQARKLDKQVLFKARSDNEGFTKEEFDRLVFHGYTSAPSNPSTPEVPEEEK
ncbi:MULTISPECIES: major tail protein [Bacillus]|uniref:major tail protein n=1 Tax=Bacillus TaxID=1386 RepID=UPI0011A69E53|nr:MULTISPECIES: major tail protein [Bacillus]MDD0822659.1 phage tail protein [Bacillus cereus]